MNYTKVFLEAQPLSNCADNGIKRGFMVSPIYITPSLIARGTALPSSVAALSLPSPFRSVFMMNESGGGSPSNTFLTRFPIGKLVVEHSADAAYAGSSCRVELRNQSLEFPL